MRGQVHRAGRVWGGLSWLTLANPNEHRVELLQAIGGSLVLTVDHGLRVELPQGGPVDGFCRGAIKRSEWHAGVCSVGVSHRPFLGTKRASSPMASCVCLLSSLSSLAWKES